MSESLITFTAYTALIVLQLTLLFALSRYMNRALFSSFGAVVYLLVALPGTVVHELSHYLGCLLTGTRVSELRPFSPHREGERFVLGHVRHARPRGPLSAFIIGTAPFWGGAAVLWFFAWLLTPDAFRAAAVPLSQGGPEAALGGLATVVSEVMRSLAAPDWRAWAMLYLLISVPVHLAPSSEDLKNAAWGIIFVCALLTLSTLVADRFGSVASGRVLALATAPLSVLSGLLSFALVCCLAISFLVRVLTSLIRR